LLAGYFVEQTRRKLGLKQLKITEQAINLLEQYHWPGNVRELEHVVSRAALKARARQKSKAIIAIEKVDCGTLANTLQHAKSQATTDSGIKDTSGFEIEVSLAKMNLRDETERFQRQLITKILTEENGNWAATARRLATDRANLNRIAKRLNIKVVKVIA